MIAQRILKARKAARLSREKLAQGLDMSSRTVERWEKGQTEPGDGDVLLLARLLGVGEDWLRTGAGPMHIPHTSREHVPGDSPAVGSVKAGIAGEGSSGYDVGRITLTIDTEDDVQLLPAWAMPIIIGAASIIIQRVDVERARRAEERGRKYRLRVIVEDHDDDEPEQQGLKDPQA